MTARALVAGVRDFASKMLPGIPTGEPYMCDLGSHTTTRFTGAQYAATTSKRLPPCARRGCLGVVWRAAALESKRRAAWAELGPGYREFPS